MQHEVKKIISDIKAVKIQGAREVAKAGIKALEITAKKSKNFNKEFKETVEELIKARPTEPELRNAVNYITRNAKNNKQALKLCKNYVNEVKKAKELIASYGSNLIENNDVILTHCHSNTVIDILKKAKKQKKKFEVIVTETRPLMQGKVTAKELKRIRVPVTYLIDAASTPFMHKASKVLVGADAILADGSIVNKIGTYQIALAAQEYKVPFLVAAGTHKFDPLTIKGYEEPIEVRKAKEVWKNAPRGIKIINLTFDVTPPKYIDKMITERGVYNPSSLIAILNSNTKGV